MQQKTLQALGKPPEKEDGGLEETPGTVKKEKMASAAEGRGDVGHVDGGGSNNSVDTPAASNDDVAKELEKNEAEDVAGDGTTTRSSSRKGSLVDSIIGGIFGRSTEEEEEVNRAGEGQQAPALKQEAKPSSRSDGPADGGGAAATIPNEPSESLTIGMWMALDLSSPSQQSPSPMASVILQEEAASLRKEPPSPVSKLAPQSAVRDVAQPASCDRKKPEPTAKPAEVPMPSKGSPGGGGGGGGGGAAAVPSASSLGIASATTATATATATASVATPGRLAGAAVTQLTPTTADATTPQSGIPTGSEVAEDEAFRRVDSAGRRRARCDNVLDRLFGCH